jgi:hypothetical protein
MDRISEYSLYNINVSNQSGGGERGGGERGGGGERSHSPKKRNYKPSDIDGETSTAIDKFRKANRLLQKELSDIKKDLDIEKEITSKLKKQLEASKLNLI